MPGGPNSNKLEPECRTPEPLPLVAAARGHTGPSAPAPRLPIAPRGRHQKQKAAGTSPAAFA